MEQTQNKTIELRKGRKQSNMLNGLYNFIKAKLKKDADFGDLAHITLGQFQDYPGGDRSKATVIIDDKEVVLPITCLPPSTLLFKKGEYLVILYWKNLSTARVLGRYDTILEGVSGT